MAFPGLSGQCLASSWEEVSVLESSLAHSLFEFVLFGALLALMFFLGLAGLGAGGFPFGLGGLLRLVRPAVRFLSWMVLCCSCSLSSHCWEAICKHDGQVRLTPLCYSTDLRTNDISPSPPDCYILIMTIVIIPSLHCWALILYQRLVMKFGQTCIHFIETLNSPCR